MYYTCTAVFIILMYSTCSVHKYYHYSTVQYRLYHCICIVVLRFILTYSSSTCDSNVYYTILYCAVRDSYKN